MLKPAFRYANRKDAGKALAAKLKKYAAENPVAIGLPRGGVIVAVEVARALPCDFDVIIAGKLRAPLNPELAIGAVNEDGLVFLNKDVLGSLHAGEDYLNEEKARLLVKIKERLKAYRAIKKKVPLKGRAVLLIDDGLATGSTMVSAVQAAHAEGATKIIVAVPGGPEDTINKISSMKHVTEVICPVVPPVFFAVSQLYESFQQTEEDEVIAILKQF
ncbi:phosphoribosyltransferase [bacterium]|nr:MAG: phosphoribosyltransferase [bacterium]